MRPQGDPKPASHEYSLLQRLHRCGGLFPEPGRIAVEGSRTDQNSGTRRLRAGPMTKWSNAEGSLDDGLRLDLDFVVADQTGNLKHRVGGTRHAECAAVRARDRLPLIGVAQIDAGAYDVFDARA
jgi:hypothetical protein